MEQKSVRSQLHTLVGKEMRLGKRANMYGGVLHHVEAHEKAEIALEKFLKENPSMVDHVEAVEGHFTKNLYQ